MGSARTMVVAMLACAAVSSAAFAQDWAQWMGPGRDAKAAGFTAPAEWPASLKEVWKVTVGKGDSSPALVGDRLYVFARQGEDEVTLCLGTADGKEIWKDKNPAPAVKGPASGAHAGPRSSPAVADGKVVTLGVTGVLSCLNAADGKLIWRKDEYPNAYPEFYTAMSPMIVDGMVIAHLGGQGKGALTAFGIAGGDVKWKCENEPAMYSSPVAMTVEGVKQIVTLSDKSVIGVAVDDGKLLWEVPFVPQGRAYNAATPIVDGQEVIVSGAGRGTVCLKIEKDGEKFAAKEQWKNPTAVQYNTPVLKDGKLFGLTDKGFLFCMNAEDGKTLWTDSAARGRGFCAIVDAGSALVALPSTSELLVYKPGDAGYEQVAGYKVSDGATYAFPILSGDRIFVKGGDSLTLWSVK